MSLTIIGCVMVLIAVIIAAGCVDRFRANRVDDCGMTPLMHLCLALDPIREMVTLIRHGADVNAKDDDGQTPLLFAAGSSSPEIARLLIEEGAEVNARDIDGWTPLLSAVLWSKTPEIVTLLIDAGADVNAKDNDGWTPLMIAAQHSSTPEIVTVLVEAGAV
jgi:uncharacterized protein